MAAIIHDAELDTTPELVNAAAAAAALALDNERLKADLRARVEDLRISRARIVEAADAARRRLERDLHDGAQQQLVSLALDLRLLRARLKGTDVVPMVEEISDKLAVALAELRELARGIHPAILTDRGLGPAVQGLADRVPLPVEVDVELDERPAPQIEAAAYFVTAEALTNVARYARAHEARVKIRRTGEGVVVVVSDDGVGGADIEGGTGLRGLQDRLAALDGRLAIQQPARPGHDAAGGDPGVTRLAACLLALVLLAGCGDTRETREPDVVVREATPADEAPATGGGDARVQHLGRHPRAGLERVLDDRAQRDRGRAAADGRRAHLPLAGRLRRRHDARADRARRSPPSPTGSSSRSPAPSSRRRSARPCGRASRSSRSTRAATSRAARARSRTSASRRSWRATRPAGGSSPRARTRRCASTRRSATLGLDRRCAGFARAMREAGGSSRVIAIDTNKDLDAARERIRQASSRPGVDAVLTLNSQGGEMAAEVAPAGSVLGTFDYSPTVLRAVRTGRMEFAVDQQPYLQGYLPVVFLAELARYGLFPAQGDVVATGPNFVTAATAEQAERLSEQGIR